MASLDSFRPRTPSGGVDRHCVDRFPDQEEQERVARTTVEHDRPCTCQHTCRHDQQQRHTESSIAVKLSAVSPRQQTETQFKSTQETVLAEQRCCSHGGQGADIEIQQPPLIEVGSPEGSPCVGNDQPSKLTEEQGLGHHQHSTIIARHAMRVRRTSPGLQWEVGTDE